MLFLMKQLLKKTPLQHLQGCKFFGAVERI